MPAGVRALRVLVVAAECVPFAQAGGMGEVVAELPRALARRGHDLRIVMPWYRAIDIDRLGVREVGRMHVDFDGKREPVTIGRSDAIGTPVYLLRHRTHTARMYRGRSDKYGWYDEPTRFRFFAAAVAAFVAQSDWRPDAIHLNDHHTGLVPAFLPAKRPAVILTIHNARFQGGFWHPFVVPRAMRDRDAGPLAPLRSRRARFTNFLRRAIRASDVVVAVSENYARELVVPGAEDDLAPVLDRKRLVGIRNGINLEQFDPSRDRQLASRYDARTLDRRARNKRALQQLLGLPISPRTPLLALVARLDEQKGPDLIIQRLAELADLDVQLAFMGDGEMRAAFERLARAAPTFFSYRPFDRAIETLYYAGADILLVPSRYEPCGLVQLKALRYGAVPVVHEVGGLADTVIEHDPRRRRGTGFTYADNDADQLLAAIERALATLRRPGEWRALQRRGMATDVSWDHSAARYEAVYRRALRRAR